MWVADGQRGCSYVPAFRGYSRFQPRDEPVEDGNQGTDELQARIQRLNTSRFHEHPPNAEWKAADEEDDEKQRDFLAPVTSSPL